MRELATRARAIHWFSFTCFRACVVFSFFLDSTRVYTQVSIPLKVVVTLLKPCMFVTGMKKTRRCIVVGMCTSGRIRYYEAWTSVWKKKKSQRHPEKDTQNANRTSLYSKRMQVPGLWVFWTCTTG